ncbi:hypothetical protein OG342_00890 [Streptomyces bobili]|uniref:hypothetical protein n=1 Tax=Streptomyces bobili TaxID=67280 RepID=UPI00225521DF|nr:hypothetical protein [Streptomyces bobili]MCX5521449.1 hypothetical protein [Streptomyces bobili]
MSRLTKRFSLERMPSVFFGRIEGLAEVAGAHRPACVGQGGEDLLVGGVVRDVGAVRPGGG